MVVHGLLLFTTTIRALIPLNVVVEHHVRLFGADTTSKPHHHHMLCSLSPK